MNHYFDADGFYTHTLPAGKGRVPRNASRKPLPAAPWGDMHPQYKGKVWELAARPVTAAPETETPKNSGSETPA